MPTKSKLKKKKSTYKNYIACYEECCPVTDEIIIKARSLKEAHNKAQKLLRTDSSLIGLCLSTVTVEQYNDEKF